MTTLTVPQPPAGFEIEEESVDSIPPPPHGYVIEPDRSVVGELGAGIWRGTMGHSFKQGGGLTQAIAGAVEKVTGQNFATDLIRSAGEAGAALGESYLQGTPRSP